MSQLFKTASTFKPNNAASVFRCFVNLRRHLMTQQQEAKGDPNSADERLEVKLEDGKVVKLSSQWLRDSCSCPACKHPTSGLHLHTDPSDCAVENTQLKDDLLHVTWSSGHRSTYNFKSLLNKNNESWTSWLEPQKVLWNRQEAQNVPFARLDYEELLRSDASVTNFLGSVLKYGIALVEGVPATSRDTKKAMERFGPIWRTFWGEIYHVVADLSQFAHPSYTGNAVQLHTDTNYYREGAGLQAFHVLEHIGDGAINCFVDGFYLAETLKRKEPEVFEFLSKTPVPFKYDEESRRLLLVNEDTIFRLHPLTKELLQVRYTPYDLDVYRCHPQSDMELFYHSIFTFQSELKREENSHKIHLKPGTMLVTDNWRVLHGRSEFTGKRTLCGMYVSRSDFLSKARILGLIS